MVEINRLLIKVAFGGIRQKPCPFSLYAREYIEEERHLLWSQVVASFFVAGDIQNNLRADLILLKNLSKDPSMPWQNLRPGEAEKRVKSILSRNP